MIVFHCRYTSHHFAIKKVIHGLVGELCKIDLSSNLILLVNKNNVSDFVEYKNIKTFVIPIDSNSTISNHLFNIFCLPVLLLFLRARTIVFPQISFFLFTGVRTVVFIHDLIEYKIRNQKFTKHIARHIFFPWISKRADLVVTVSENSKRDIIECLGVNQSKILVVYDGVDHIIPFAKHDKRTAATAVKEKFGIQNYVLYVGYLTLPQKNLLFLLRSLKEFFISAGDSETNIVFVGPTGKDHALIFSEIELLGLTKRFIYLGTLSEEDLALVYKAATVFCFPSLYEGFGMPVIEAMACGCPVICSNRSSLPEVVGSAGILVDPESTDSMISALKTVLGCDTFRADMEIAGLLNVQRFTWQHAAKTLASRL